MASKPETVFINSVNRHVDPAAYYMKNHNEYVGGVADSWYSGLDGDLWIEYKFVILPKRDTTMIVPALSTLQKAWCRDRHAEGRNIIVIVGCKEGGVIFNFPEDWEVGLSAEEFVSKIKSRQEIAAFIETEVL